MLMVTGTPLLAAILSIAACTDLKLPLPSAATVMVTAAEADGVSTTVAASAPTAAAVPEHHRRTLLDVIMR
ncbi:hypothetical protein Axi01nite_72060 [Actinoplanes xinjiangensis]|nr:hypothetical protein Axi01nite_72060 [Actinoplanes xinjiangensis]